MLKKLSKLLAFYQATRHSHRHGPSYGSASYEPWKRKKRKGHGHDRYGGHGHQPYGPSQGYDRPPYPSHGYGPDHGPYGHGRPRGFKGMIIDAIVRKLLKHR